MPEKHRPLTETQDRIIRRVQASATGRIDRGDLVHGVIKGAVAVDRLVALGYLRAIPMSLTTLYELTEKGRKYVGDE